MISTTIEDGRLKVRINSFVNFKEEEKVSYLEAATKLEAVINTNEFVQRFLKLKLTSTKGFSHWEILALIYSGKEELQPIADQEIDVDVTMYETNNSVVGYTNPGTIRTWINRKFFRAYSAAEVAGNLKHEWLHKVGFGHKSAKEKTSVPYAVGYLVRDLIRELDHGALFTKLKPAFYFNISSLYPQEVIEVPTTKKLVCRRRFKNFFRKVCTYEYEKQEECCHGIKDRSCY